MGSLSAAARIERIAGSPLTLPLLSAVAFGVILWLGRDATYTADELIWVIDNQDLSLSDALEPSNGHLLVVTRLVYAALVEIQGTDYFAFRLLSALTVILLTWTVYLYARPRVGAALALAPCLPLLVFGSSAGHVLVGNGFTVLLAVSCGLAAFALVTGERRSGSVAACALLCLGVATYSVALAFLVGVAIYLIAQRDWRRLWIPAVPALGYVVWWLWATSAVSSSDSAIAFENLLALPAWLFQLLGYALAAFSGLGYDFGGEEIEPALAVALAVVAIGLSVWWLRSRRVTHGVVGAAASLIGLSALSVLVASFVRAPSDGRFLYPATAAVLAIVVEAVRGRRPPAAVLVGVYAIVIVGAAANLLELSNEARTQRETTTPGLRAALGGLELSRPNTNPGFDPEADAGDDTFSVFALAWDGEEITGNPTTGYLELTGGHGAIGFSEAEIREQPEDVRAVADRHLIGALGIEPVQVPTDEAPCRPSGPSRQVYSVDPGQEVVLESETDTILSMRRLAETSTTEVGNLTAGSPALLSLPEDEVAGPWVIFADGASFGICTVS